MPDIIFYEAFKEEEQALKEVLPAKIEAEFTAETIQAKQEQAPPAPLISIRTQSIIPLEWAAGLSGILARSAGYDHLLDYCSRAKKNISCGYLVDYCSRAVAEHGMMAVFVLLRKLKRQIKQFGKFERDDLTGSELLGKSLLVVGVGKIGSQVVDIAKGLGMKVKGVDIAPKKKDVEHVALAEGIQWADIVICATPLTNQTKAMLGYDLLRQAKPGMVFVNIARAEISPPEDLKKLLEEGVLSGVSLDVYPNEGLFAEFLRGSSGVLTPNMKSVLELNEYDNVLLTPHNAFNTEEAVREKARQTKESLQRFLSEKKFVHQIDS